MIWLIFAIVGIGVLATKRGTSPVFWVVAAIIGILLFGYVIGPIVVGVDLVRNNVFPNLAVLIPSMLAWIWVGALAIYVRFGIGAGQPQPRGMWTCPECKTLNQQSSLFCDSCGDPWPAGS